MPRKTPFNIYSIEDLDAWRREFAYPLSTEVCEKIKDGACALLLDLYAEIPGSLKSHYRIASKPIFLELYDLLMKMIMASEMRSRPDEEFILTNHRCPPDVKLPESCSGFDLYLGRADPPFPNVSLAYDDAMYRGVPIWKRVGVRLRDLLKSVAGPRLRDASTLMINPNHCTLKYVKMQGEGAPFLVRPASVLGISFPPPGDQKTGGGGIRDIARSLCAGVDKLHREICGREFNSEILKRFEGAVSRLFSRIDRDLNQAGGYLKNARPHVRMYTGTAKYFTRIFAEIVRARGGEVIGFPHEGGLSGLDLPFLSFTEFATCDRFVCFDEKDARDYRRHHTINKIDFMVAPGLGESILNMDPQRFRKSSGIDLGKISTIMYLNYSYWYDKYSYGIRSDLQGLDFQLRLIDFLLPLKKTIVFKLRPKTAYLSKEYRHFGYFGDRVEYTAIPFRELLDKADLFILEGLASTALHEAMTLTTKPILLFKPGVPKCTPEFENMVRQRCYVIDLFEDERNRLCFDEDQLRGAFAS